MKQIIYLLVSIIYSSCQSLPNNTIIINDFPSSIHLKGNENQYFDKELGIISLQTTNRYFICNTHRTDYHFSIYSKDTIIKRINLCKKGRGSNEFIAPAFFSQFENQNNQTKIWVLDRAVSQLVKINIDLSIKEDKTYIEESLSLLDYIRFPLKDIFFINDTLLFGTEDNDECRHFLLNLNIA